MARVTRLDQYRTARAAEQAADKLLREQVWTRAPVPADLVDEPEDQDDTSDETPEGAR